MGKWKYEGVNREGKRLSGDIEAASEREARKLLRAQGIRAKKLAAPSLLELDLSEWMVDAGLAKPFGTSELTNMTKQLSIMINAGVPIMQSLEILFKQEKNPVLKKTIKSISTDVGEGKTLAEAMASKKGFSKLYCNLVKAGEAGGILDTILDKLAIHLDKQERTKKQIKSAMTYPGIVVTIGVAVVYFMLVFVVPKMSEMLASSGQKLPALTQMVVDVSEWLQEYTLIVLPIMFFSVALLNAYVKSESGKVIFDNVMMKMPIFGTVIIKGNLNSFSRTLGTMLSSGIALIDSLDICIETLDNVVMANDLKQVRKAITEGKTLTDPLAKIPYFPDMVAQMIKVGEQTGNLDTMLEKISDVFEEDVNNAVESMTKMIEPIILVVLGGFVAVILVAMYLPVFQSASGV